MRRIVPLLVCLLPAGGMANAQGKIRAGHPRIYVTAKDVPRLRARCAGDMKELFGAMRGADWIMKRRAGAGWSDVSNVGYPAFRYLVTREAPCLAKTKEFLQALSAK